MNLQDYQAHLLDCRAHGQNLVEQAIAGLSRGGSFAAALELIQHALEATYLTFDPAQACPGLLAELRFRLD
jgi:hypothetical protein